MSRILLSLHSPALLSLVITVHLILLLLIAVTSLLTHISSFFLIPSIRFDHHDDLLRHDDCKHRLTAVRLLHGSLASAQLPLPVSSSSSCGLSSSPDPPDCLLNHPQTWTPWFTTCVSPDTSSASGILLFCLAATTDPIHHFPVVIVLLFLVPDAVLKQIHVILILVTHNSRRRKGGHRERWLESDDSDRHTGRRTGPSAGDLVHGHESDRQWVIRCRVSGATGRSAVSCGWHWCCWQLSGSILIPIILSVIIDVSTDTSSQQSAGFRNGGHQTSPAGQEVQKS